MESETAVKTVDSWMRHEKQIIALIKDRGFDIGGVLYALNVIDNTVDIPDQELEDYVKERARILRRIIYSLANETWRKAEGMSDVIPNIRS
jgi:hypothetical protein